MFKPKQPVLKHQQVLQSHRIQNFFLHLLSDLFRKDFSALIRITCSIMFVSSVSHPTTKWSAYRGSPLSREVWLYLKCELTTSERGPHKKGGPHTGIVNFGASIVINSDVITHNQYVNMPTKQNLLHCTVIKPYSVPCFTTRWLHLMVVGRIQARSRRQKCLMALCLLLSKNYTLWTFFVRY